MSTRQETTVKEVLPGIAWTIDPLLKAEECQELIQQATDAKIQESTAAGDRRHRNCCSHYFANQDLSQRIWERLQQHVPNQIEFLDQHKTNPPTGFRCDDVPDMLGKWTACGVNPQFTQLYYTPGGHFGPHRDGYKVISEHQRSMLTISIYLKERPLGSGGATQFLQDDMDLRGPDETGRIQAPSGTVLASVEGDSIGKAVVFWHDVMHQGQPLSTDCLEPKWLLITQVMFERDPTSAPQLSQDERQARLYLKQAEEAESRGSIQEAIRLYTRAYRLDPSLE